MRTIEVSVDVFSQIWRARRAGENSENDVLARILASALSGERMVDRVDPDISKDQESRVEQPSSQPPLNVPTGLRDAAWWQVVKQALEDLGGESTLERLYERVRTICRGCGKRMPQEIEATVRGTLEDNCSDSERYQGRRDVFWMPRGKGEGYWGIRSPR